MSKLLFRLRLQPGPSSGLMASACRATEISNRKTIACRLLTERSQQAFQSQLQIWTSYLPPLGLFQTPPEQTQPGTCHPEKIIGSVARLGWCKEEMRKTHFLCFAIMKHHMPEWYRFLIRVDLIYQEKFTTRAQALRRSVEYIDVWYNRERVHSSIDYSSLVEFERKYFQPKKCETELTPGLITQDSGLHCLGLWVHSIDSTPLFAYKIVQLKFEFGYFHLLPLFHQDEHPINHVDLSGEIGKICRVQNKFIGVRKLTETIAENTYPMPHKVLADLVLHS